MVDGDEARLPLLPPDEESINISVAPSKMSASAKKDSQRSPGNLVVRFIATIWFALLVVAAFILTFLSQLTAWILLFPMYLAKPSIRFQTQGLIFRFFQNCAAFYLNPFWRIRVMRLPPVGYVPHGKVLVMCNHSSGADAFVFNRAIFPWEFKWVYKADLHKLPVAGLVLQLAGDLPLYFTRDKGGWGTLPGTVKNLMERVKRMGTEHGIGTVVFPEGTRSATGRLQPFKDGFFRFAAENKWDILPLVAHNSPSLWPLGGKLVGVGTTYVMFGNPITPKANEQPDELRNRVRNIMVDLMALSPLYDQNLDAPLEHLPETRGHGVM
eukprot:Gregarina_sp_Poly_1__4026@NODE_2219_length_2472_cov_268_755094_g1430_i0_p1_GENE_NODE_2219_length_2472_cov_268_755094_g1430_i0NODE_2219_length_2472_cov_268_755094_g1430_i0_p1_ORF_typecomplete_len325_score26_83Acyltransferase/PF01553_21/1_3e17_NODE_2219_length_2472_cov_268_755094_g1430_i014382412